MNISTVSEFRKAMRHGPYAWSGGYPCYFITADGAALSFKAAKECRRQIIQAITEQDTNSGWCVVALSVNWEDQELTCDHTGEPIESAYGEE